MATKTLKKELQDLKNKYIIQNIVLVGLAITGIVSFITFRSIVLFELGAFGFMADLTYELIGTKRGWWKYSYPSLWKIANRVPIEVPLTYFFMGVVAAAFVFFRLT